MPKDGTRFSRESAELVLNEVYKMLVGFDYEVCGSYRRGSPDVGDLDILVVKTGDKINLSNVNVEWKGDDKIGFEMNGIHVDIKFVPIDCWGAGLLHHTGPDGFNVKLRSIAKKKGMKLNEYGLFDRESGEIVVQKTEKEILFALMNEKSAEKFLDPQNRKTPSWLKK